MKMEVKHSWKVQTEATKQSGGVYTIGLFVGWLSYKCVCSGSVTESGVCGREGFPAGLCPNHCNRKHDYKTNKRSTQEEQWIQC